MSKNKWERFKQKFTEPDFGYWGRPRRTSYTVPELRRMLSKLKFRHFNNEKSSHRYSGVTFDARVGFHFGQLRLAFMANGNYVTMYNIEFDGGAPSEADLQFYKDVIGVLDPKNPAKGLGLNKLVNKAINWEQRVVNDEIGPVIARALET